MKCKIQIPIEDYMRFNEKCADCYQKFKKKRASIWFFISIVWFVFALWQIVILNLLGGILLILNGVVNIIIGLIMRKAKLPKVLDFHPQKPEDYKIISEKEKIIVKFDQSRWSSIGILIFGVFLLSLTFLIVFLLKIYFDYDSLSIIIIGFILSVIINYIYIEGENRLLIFPYMYIIGPYILVFGILPFFWFPNFTIIAVMYIHITILSLIPASVNLILSYFFFKNRSIETEVNYASQKVIFRRITQYPKTIKIFNLSQFTNLGIKGIQASAIPPVGFSILYFRFELQSGKMKILKVYESYDEEKVKKIRGIISEFIEDQATMLQ